MSTYKFSDPVWVAWPDGTKREGVVTSRGPLMGSLSVAYLHGDNSVITDAVQVTRLEPRVAPAEAAAEPELSAATVNGLYDYTGHDWIKVKQFRHDPAKDNERNYQALMDHHVAETKFLIAEVRKLAGVLNARIKADRMAEPETPAPHPSLDDVTTVLQLLDMVHHERPETDNAILDAVASILGGVATAMGGGDK